MASTAAMPGDNGGKKQPSFSRAIRFAYFPRDLPFGLGVLGSLTFLPFISRFGDEGRKHVVSNLDALSAATFLGTEQLRERIQYFAGRCYPGAGQFSLGVLTRCLIAVTIS